MEASKSVPPDDLLLIHCHINVIRELFDECDDTAVQTLLSQVKEGCC